MGVQDCDSDPDQESLGPSDLSKAQRGRICRDLDLFAVPLVRLRPPKRAPEFIGSGTFVSV